jgi:hypothetical protein
VRIISGGQTGVDRAALDVASELGFETGGWVPFGRAAEDGVISSRYDGLTETETNDPAERTIRNVRDADATVLISRGALSGGSHLTLAEAIRQGKPVMHLELGRSGRDGAEQELKRWLSAVEPRVLNVAGPRASEEPDIYDRAARLLRRVLIP